MSFSGLRTQSGALVRLLAQDSPEGMTANEQGPNGASVEREGVWRKQGVQKRGIGQKGRGAELREMAH